jgi:O-antigen/teichoic acid export membrane protein
LIIVKPKGSTRTLGRDEAAYFLSFNAANALNYAYLVLMGFLLAGDSYGLFGALFGVVYLTSALANTVQVSTAKVVAEARAATDQGLPASLVTALLVRVAGTALIAGLVALAASPFLARIFDASLWPLAWASLAIALSVLVAAFYGILQGQQDFPWLGANVLAASALRLAFGGALVVAGWGVAGALAGIALSYAVSGLLALMRVRSQVQLAKSPWPLRGIGQAIGMILAASLAIAFPTSFDVALVKHYLSSEEASLFTAISVLGRIVLFLPLALSFIAFPKVASARVRGDSTWPLLLATLVPVAALSLISALALLALVSFAGFSPADVNLAEAGGAVAWYLMAMVLFALVVVFIYHNLGRNSGSYVFGILFPCLLVQGILLISWHDSLTMVAQVVFASNAVLMFLSFGHALAPLPAWRRLGRVSLTRSKPLGAD